ncbi:alpha/beta fold hydrolase [Sphingomonas sp.]|uniref:alpha/beta fold hydrolase n=1 Tax=Sphingomonas sp. TaxID=28214 RepID=UPI003CC50E97
MMLRPARLAMALLLTTPAAALAQPASSPAASAAPAPPADLKLFPDSRVVTHERISVEITGKGPDIVMIPGLASSRETWRGTAERLRGRYRVHLVQVAGFGGEPARANASGPFFDPTLAEIDAYCATLKRPIVMGHSLGGTFGLALAQKRPEHLSKLLIVDSLPFYGVLMGGPNATVETVKPMAEAMTKPGGAGGFSPAQYRQMIAAMVTAPADVERVLGWGQRSDGRVVAQAMHDDMLADLRPGLAAMKTPVTVIYETPIAAAVTTGYAPLTTKTLVPVADAKHFIMYDQPARFDAEVDAFLKR